MPAFQRRNRDRTMNRRLLVPVLYLRDKLREARLALTNVTPAQLLVRKATGGRRRGGPDAGTLKAISRAAFEIGDYWRIVGVLHRRLERLDGKRWRRWYGALVVLEHVVVHGPDSASREFQPCRDAIRRQAAAFRHVDGAGFDWGLAVRRRAEWVLELLERGPVLREERERARAVVKRVQDIGGGSVWPEEVTPPPAPGLGGRGRGRSPWDENEGKCSTGDGVRGSCRGTAGVLAAGRNLEPARQDLVALLPRAGNWSGEVSEETVPLLADDSLLRSSWWVQTVVAR